MSDELYIECNGLRIAIPCIEGSLTAEMCTGNTAFFFWCPPAESDQEIQLAAAVVDDAGLPRIFMPDGSSLSGDHLALYPGRWAGPIQIRCES